jgi:hypothetical protein
MRAWIATATVDVLPVGEMRKCDNDSIYTEIVGRWQ